MNINDFGDEVLCVRVVCYNCVVGAAAVVAIAVVIVYSIYGAHIIIGAVADAATDAAVDIILSSQIRCSATVTEVFCYS